MCQIYIVCSLFVMLAGCAAPQKPFSAFETIPANKSMITTSRFEPIHDFANGVEKTRFGTKWNVTVTGGAKAKLTPDGEDAIRYGASAALEYTIPAGGEVKLAADLKGLDISQAEHLVMLLRLEELDCFPGKATVGLTDTTGKTRATEIRGALCPLLQGPAGRWIEVQAPRSAFKELDFNKLQRFEMVLSSAEDVRGKLVFDEIAFFGKDNLVFESARDNLTGFPAVVANPARGSEVRQEPRKLAASETLGFRRRAELIGIRDDKEFLRRIAADTWRYFENAVDRESHLPVDHIRQDGSGGIGSYASPTNIAFYWLANIGARDLGLISGKEAAHNVRESLRTLTALKQWDGGLYYNYYHTRSLGVTREYVSSVDNGWLAAGLVAVRQAFSGELAREADRLFERMDLAAFYDPSNGQLKLGFDAEKGEFSPYHYGLLATEARIASYAAIGKGDLKEEHWARIYRTLPEEWSWQKQKPEGTKATLFGQTVFEGHYTYLGKKFVPSWGGSLFEFLAPTLLFDEQRLAPRGLARNNEIVTDLAIEYALAEKRYPVWGFAPCAVANGVQWIYREYGVPAMGAKERGYVDGGVVAPYVSFLALATRPKEAVRNLRELLKRYEDVYGEYGFFDSVDLSKGKVNHQYLVLDQGMSFVAMVNLLEDGGLKRYIHQDPVGKRSERLLQEEVFSIE